MKIFLGFIGLFLLLKFFEKNKIKKFEFKNDSGVVSYYNGTYHLGRIGEKILVKGKKVKFLNNRLCDWKETEWEDFIYIEYNGKKIF